MTISGRTTKQHVIIIITCCTVIPSEKITRKASDAAEKNAIIPCCSVVPPAITVEPLILVPLNFGVQVHKIILAPLILASVLTELRDCC